MINHIRHVETVQAREASPTSLVVDTDHRIPNHTHSSVAVQNNTNDPRSYVAYVNNPRLRTKVSTSILRLAFLKRCRFLKRPPQIFRIKASSLTPLKSLIDAAQIAESKILENAIAFKQEEIRQLKHYLTMSDERGLLEPSDREIKNVQKALDRKFNWLKKQDATLWSKWPEKSFNSQADPCVKSLQHNQLPAKRKRNSFKKARRAQNKIKKLAKAALDSRSIINLTNIEIPPEAVVVLAKRIGFVPTSQANHLQTRIDANKALAKLCRDTKRLLFSYDPDVSTSLEPISEQDDGPNLPSCLRRPFCSTPVSSEDALVDGLCEDIFSVIDNMEPKTSRPNLNSYERLGLQWVLAEAEKGDLQFVKADKGGALCIIERSFMKELELQKLDDTSQFICLGEKDLVPDVFNSMLDLWRSGESQGYVSREESYNVVGLCETGRPSTLSIFKPGLPYYYGLLKIHKLNPNDLIPGKTIPLRLVNDLSQAPTVRSDKFLNWKFLQPLQEEFCKDLVKDSTEALGWLEDIAKSKSAGLSGFSWDFSSLYDNLSPEFVLEALTFAISELRSDWSNDFVGWLISLLELSLKSCFGKHGNSWYLNKSGIATGGSLSVSLANIAVYYAIRCAIYDSDNNPKELLSLRRFVDDLTGIWTGTFEEFIAWSDSVNQNLHKLGLSIKDNDVDPWDFIEPGAYTTFLDIKYMFSETGSLTTDINIKATDARVYLNYSSYHPRQTFPSIVYSQGLRYRRIINDDIKLFRRLDELKGCFIRSGYPKKMVENIFDDVVTRPRNLEYKKKEKKAPSVVMWTQTFGPETPVIKKVVKEANEMLQKCPVWSKNDKVISVVNRRPKNIGDMILKRKRLALSTGNTPGTNRCSPLINQNRSKKKGRPCTCCPMMSNSESIRSSATGKSFKLPEGNCKSRNVIYCAECSLCNKQYTGKSSNKLQTRIAGHRSHVGYEDGLIIESDERTLAEHLQEIHHLHSVDTFNSNYSFTVLELSPRNLDLAEQKWVNKLLTIEPFGLNKEKPGGVLGSFRSMVNRSLDLKIQCL